MDAKQISKPKATTQRKTQGPPKSRRKLRKPAYLQRKLQVSDPQDAEEKEADAVAADVRRSARPAPDEETPPVASAQRVVGRTVARQADEEEEEAMMPKVRRQEEEEAAQPKLQREEEEEAAQTKLMRQLEEEEETAQTKLWRKGEEEEAQTKLRRQTGDEEEEPLMAKLWRQQEEEPEAAAPSEEQEETSAALLEQKIQNSRGNGSPLPDAVLKDMEQQFGNDFSHVVIHNDNEAAELCRELNARAFTVGSDIYFAPGEFTPETEAGRELLAHELTHVIQQGRQVARKIYRAGGAASAAAPAATPTERATQRGATLATNGVLTHPTLGEMDRSAHTITLPRIDLPGVKKPFTPQPCVIEAGRTRDNTQSSVWDGAVQEGSLDSALTTKVADAPSMTINNEPAYYLKLKRENQFIMGTKPQIVQQLKRPRWNRQGSFRTYDVDHKREFQLGGADGDIANFWLLESSANRSSGSKINNELNRKIDDLLALGRHVWSANTVRSSAINARARDEVTITQHGATMRVAGHPEDHYTIDQINSGAHLSGLNVLNERQIRHYNLQGSPTRIVIFSNPNGGQRASIPWREGQQQVELGQDPGWGFSGRNSAASIRVTQLNYQQAAGSTEGGTGTVTGFAYSQNKYLQGQPFTWNIVPMAGVMYGGVIDPSSVQGWVRNRLRAKGFSPVEIDNAQLQGGVGLVAGGQINCDLPLLRGTRIGLNITGSDVEVDATIPIDGISLPRPISITHSSLRIFAGTRGFGAEGMIGVEIENLGSGEIRAGMSSEQAFEAQGKFNFDPNLFDRAEIDAWYRNGQFGGRGTIGIDQPDKIKGIRSANITAEYNEGAFSATGDVQPDIPGIQQAGLSVAYSEEAGLTIGGNLQLTANPAIRSGSIDVTVNKRGDDWRVSASGTAQPAIPGVDSQLTVSYDDGAFTAEFSGAFQRGMLSGRVTVGATNRAVGEDGRPSGDPLPEGALNIYGSGSATIQIAPWLQGTAGIRFDPNGEVTVSGEIGIPNEVEIFARREINKSIFNIAVQAPIVPGIVAEVGGGLSAVAGIGPGVIDEMRIGITYNPAHEENTRVTGDAHLRVPADAGLRLSVRAGIGLGITGASATGGLEIGGTLGIEGAAEAGVHIDWTPSDGLDISANLAVHAQPSFTFDISGYVSVRALGFSVYDERWQFASYTFGSGYRFGIRLPVHYHEGEPFDISLDDVQFEVPDIDTNQLLRGLIGRIA
ncbi:hypothetical protein GCM10011348_02800 [Marinobacterium nitratireducens]|uniref:eCIS core domain-containing protein n=1 Tax=Marinobacterium nitratireducens TaxID=518897 RepID=A0A917Z7I6_9GAMM|nr:DUF4157 domain-containing protein [Marinobacterium nitratireducens]GGO76188.1 hypothetical protein GCM10011348_02800 [Marinobacterium nitratireducens]